LLDGFLRKLIVGDKRIFTGFQHNDMQLKVLTWLKQALLLLPFFICFLHLFLIKFSYMKFYFWKAFQYNGRKH